MNDYAIPQKNKHIYQSYIQEIFNEGLLEKLKEYMSPSYVLRDAPPGTPKGPDAIKQIVTMFRSGFPDLEITIEDLIAENDLVATRSTLRGTHLGSAFGMEPTGRKVTMPSLTMVRIIDGKIIESWVRNDFAGLLKQLEANHD